MDKQKIDSIPALLDCQLNILSAFYSDNKILSAKELVVLIRGLEETVTAMLTELVAYGIVTAHFFAHTELKYQLTPFGTYFCSKIWGEQDIDVQSMTEENDI